MKYFLDTEFHEYEITDILHKKVPTIELISIGIVAEDEREYYRVSNSFSFDAACANEWLKLNVVIPIIHELAPAVEIEDDIRPHTLFWKVADAIEGHDRTAEPNKIAEEILKFIGDDEQPEFFGYYCDYDWVVFCWLYGRMIDLPKHFPMYCRDLKQMLDERAAITGLTLDDIKAEVSYPKQENEHNALADARWNKQLYDFIRKL